jgi:hypothetical protein
MLGTDEHKYQHYFGKYKKEFGIELTELKAYEL